MQALGYSLVPGVLTAPECARLTGLLDRAVAQRTGPSVNLRNLFLAVPDIAELARSPRLLQRVQPWVGERAFPVRALLFDKVPGANWAVAWHQDLAIAVRRRVEVAGFQGWSVKEGVPHVHPPAAVLEGMVALRLHLDDCDATNGALMVLPGSHQSGKLDGPAIARWQHTVAPVTCELARGGALLMRPLLLHASAPSSVASHRRVIHLEYAAASLPGGLEWFEGSAA